jgi:hypothetical protein
VQEIQFYIKNVLKLCTYYKIVGNVEGIFVYFSYFLSNFLFSSYPSKIINANLFLAANTLRFDLWSCLHFWIRRLKVFYPFQFTCPRFVSQKDGHRWENKKYPARMCRYIDTYIPFHNFCETKRVLSRLKEIGKYTQGG